MHDPMTLIADLRIVQLWHKDPCRDGTDDSCGWSFPKLTEAQRKRIRDFAWDEGRNPYFLRENNKTFTGTRHEAECLFRALVLLSARAIKLDLNYDQISLFTIRHVHNGGVEDAARQLCFQPGYHTNNPTDNAEDRQQRLASIMQGIARELLAERRPWYRKPRWHFWHWRITSRLWKRITGRWGKESLDV